VDDEEHFESNHFNTHRYHCSRRYPGLCSGLAHLVAHLVAHFNAYFPTHLITPNKVTRKIAAKAGKRRVATCGDDSGDNRDGKNTNGDSGRKLKWSRYTFPRGLR
jgi:hypothetical protein